jgi:aspartyl-tRNA(Asn)/glutamyl-tRNA(Gln) amidotransferase subunit A
VEVKSSIAAVHEQFSRGDTTPRQLAEQALQRIHDTEPHLNAWATVDESAVMEQADRLTHSGLAGPLHGIPIGVKDIMHVAGLPTRCGVPFSDPANQTEDAPCVQALRAAGAVILGKTATTPFAFLDPPATTNPWNTQCTPGGSSSGSAAAVASGACLAALGSQTGGSLTRPASYCGVCAFKPAHGAIPTAGVFPLAPSLDHIGAIARTVADLRVVCSVLMPMLTLSTPQHMPAVHWLGGEFSATELELEQGCLAALRTRLNQRVLPLQWPALFEQITKTHGCILAYEAAQVHTALWQQHASSYPPRIAELVTTGMAIAAEEYDAAVAERTHLQERVLRLWPKESILATAATKDTAPDRTTTGSPALNAPWSLLGFPTLSVPCGLAANGLPYAVQFCAKPGDEAALFTVARHFEQPVL